MKKGLLAVLLVLFFSCENTNTEKSAQELQTEQALEILEAQGFRMDNVVDDGDAFIVDGDARISKEAIIDQGKRSKQYSTNYTVSQSKVSNITIAFSGSVPSVWKTATRAAIANWNAISGSKVKFTEVSSGANLTIYHQNLNSSQTIAIAEFPSSSGNVGYRVRINNYFDNNLSASRKEFTMTHEIGHCLGFRHTNWFDRNSDGNATTDDNEGVSSFGANHIPGTPTGLDGSSVMNAIVANWNGFSQYDVVATKYLYPSSSTPDPDPVNEIQGPNTVADGQSATFTSPAGSSYQWWYNTGWGWYKWSGVTSRSVTFSYNGSVSLAVVVNGSDVYYKNNIYFY